MAARFTNSIVRIFASNGKVLGVGFLVNDNTVISCDHVFSTEKKKMGEENLESQNVVELDFPLVEAGQIVTGEIQYRFPEKDIAVIKLVSKLPHNVCEAEIVTSRDFWNHRFRVFGFPAGYKDGVYASGLLRDKTAQGWIQLEDIKNTGYFIDKGFSGTPVWDEELKGVMGMVVASDREKDVRAAFVIPVELISNVYMELPEPISRPGVNSINISWVIAIISEIIGIWSFAKILPLTATYSKIILYSTPLVLLCAIGFSLLISWRVKRSWNEHLTASVCSAFLLLIIWAFVFISRY